MQKWQHFKLIHKDTGVSIYQYSLRDHSIEEIENALMDKRSQQMKEKNLDPNAYIWVENEHAFK